ncbi:tetratricopeptide repeat protein [Sulfurirhabdus autotrophica]|uniref:Tetratricopeptide repeat protein n=1 Tax=Sulfurirhabdus autotrophica TaxID=1706046 RepID=A0A4R3YES6_9PROT|nr:tetratricopeptide repeat protein [Sulfurirhabdus autotrophica]TCV89678.1 tetratricopeptide repeat protein [Sulfurirhabdus autotrophica]
MFKQLIPGMFLLGALSFIIGPVLADSNPTLHQVYLAAEAGRLGEAQGMMESVLKEHPNSSKAHYVEAEILAKQGRFENAEVELNRAESLAPGLPFAKPQAVSELKTMIASIHQKPFSTKSGAIGNTAGFPWGMLMLGIGSIIVITLVVRAITNRNAASPAGNYQAGMFGAIGQPNAAYPPGGSIAPAAPASGGIGSNIVSGLVTGAAVGAGMVAGEALVHHFMDGNRNNASAPTSIPDTWNSTTNDMGGTDFGIADNASWDDNASVADNSDIGGDDWS